MLPKRIRGALLAFLAMVTSAYAAHVHAEESARCSGGITRANVVACALRASPAIAGEQRGLAALEGRRTSASLVLPSNPTLAVNVGRRSSPIEGTGIDWNATLSQEIEIAGQRGARLAVVGAERDAQRARVAMTERDVAAGALAAYFDAIASAEEKRVADRLVELAGALTRLAQGRVEQGLASEVEADVAQAAATRLALAQITAQRHVAIANVALATALGRDVTKPIAVEGSLDPLAASNMDSESLVRLSIAQRPELAMSEAERRAQERRSDIYRRSRVPNVTLSVFVQNDRINDRVLGVGVAVPIPLPAPVGRTYAGAIAESEALAERAAAETERLRRAVRLDVLTAFENVASRKREVLLFPPERVRRAEEGLAAIARELDAHRLAVRDALLMQQGLVEFLQSSVEARRQLCLASIELARVSGVALDRGAP